MKKLWDPIVETAEDVQRVASRMIDDGVEFFRGHLGKIQLLSASNVVVGAGDEDRDEQHYFLVPNRGEECGYCLYSMRVLPDGIGPENDLPKARVFQIPSEGAEGRLVELLLGELEAEALKKVDLASPLADRLEVVAEEIDRQSNLLSGGLILVGGVVAIANPLLGVGIAAKALIPGLGSKLSVHGMKHVSDWFRGRRESSVKEDAKKDARKAVSKVKPELRVNAVLGLLERALSSEDCDPGTESLHLLDDLSQVGDYRLGVEAVTTIYQKEDLEQLRPEIRDWLKSLDVKGDLQ